MVRTPHGAAGLAIVSLIRHGQTAWSLTGQHTGRTDMPLTPRGDDEARALRPMLAGTWFDAVLTSPLRRASRTCALAGLTAVAEIDPDLAEWNYGDYEGRTSVEIGRERPGWNCYRDGCPGGESADDISRRADRLIARLQALHCSIAIFTHGEFGCSLAARWIGLPVLQGQHLQLATASVSILGFKSNHPTLPVIVQWNLRPTVPPACGATAVTTRFALPLSAPPLAASHGAAAP